MNKKELAEIKKQFNRKKKCITRICGCYFDIDGNEKLRYSTSFLNIPEEEDIKYLKLLEKVLSGKFGRNVHNCEYDRKEELHGNKHGLLMRLRDSELKDEEALDLFYRMIRETLPKSCSYLVLLAHCVYDVPVKGADGFIQEDESDSVYSYLVSAICPVELSEGALSYNEDDNCIESRFRDHVVEPPHRGFLFPAFTERATDIHTLMYYVKKAEFLGDSFLEDMFGLTAPKAGREQKESFSALMHQISAEAPIELDTVTKIESEVEQSIEAHKEDSMPYALSKEEMRHLLLRSGVDEKGLSRYDSIYADCCEDMPLIAEHVAAGKRAQIEIRDIKISVPRESLDYLETKVIDGKKCLVITADDDMLMDGMPVDIL